MQKTQAEWRRNASINGKFRHKLADLQVLREFPQFCIENGENSSKNWYLQIVLFAAKLNMKPNAMGECLMVVVRDFGRLKDGRMVHCYTIPNSFGEYVEVLDYGAAMHSVYIRDGHGVLRNVVLHAESVEHLQGRAREGFTIGRCANRIAYGRFQLEGRDIQLETGKDGHYIHGGSGNYARQMFTGKILENGVELFLRDPGMAGFDCPVDVWVTFTFDDTHTLTMSYRMTPYGTTLLCPANHAFFDFNDRHDVRDYVLHIPISCYAPRTEIGMPEGEIAPVAGTVFDYTTPVTIGERLAGRNAYFKGQRPGYDDFYVRDGEKFGLMAQITDPISGITMQVSADTQCLVFVTPPPRAEGDGDYPCFCMETQYVPNAVNCPEYIAPVYHAGETLNKKTTYQFLTSEV